MQSAQYQVRRLMVYSKSEGAGDSGNILVQDWRNGPLSSRRYRFISMRQAMKQRASQHCCVAFLVCAAEVGINNSHLL